MSSFSYLYLLRLIKTDLKCLIVEVKFYSVFTEKKRARIRNQMRARLKSNMGTFKLSVGLSFKYFFYASQRA